MKQKIEELNFNTFRESRLSLSKSFQPMDGSTGVETLKLTTPDSRPSSISHSSS